MKAHDYAAALISLKQAGNDDETIVRGLVRTLRARGHLRLAPRILRAYAQAEAEHERKHRATLVVARSEDAQKFAVPIEQAHAMLGATDTRPEVVVDDTLVGGYVLTTGTHMLDASYKQALIALYRRLTAR